MAYVLFLLSPLNVSADGGLKSTHSAAKDPTLEMVYQELLHQTSSHEKSIARDLSRTFPKLEYFMDEKGVGQENLYVSFLIKSLERSQTDEIRIYRSFNVVKAYSLYDEEVGYTQGLQFIVGPLLLNVCHLSSLASLSG